MSVLKNSFKPLLVPISEKETLEQFRERWAKIDALSEKDRDILSSDFTYNSILELSKVLSLADGEVAYISRLIRFLVWGEVKQGELDRVLGEYFKRLDIKDTAKIKVCILDILSQKSQSEAAKEKLKLLSLEEALKEFEKLGEQLITSAPLKLRVFPEPVKPSIKNWISDYRDNLGSGTHSNIDRGNYLFHSANGKKLTFLERRRMAEVLKSLDDKSELSIDPEAQKIVFESKPEEPRPVFRSLEPRAQNPKSITHNLNPVAQNPKPLAQSPQPIAHNLAPVTHNLEPTTRNPEPKTWNPAENVKKRMAEENKYFGASRIAQPKFEAHAPTRGNISFSSAHTLPIEKKREPLKPFPAGTFPVKTAPFPTEKTASLPTQKSSAPIKKAAPSIFSAPPEDDLMAKMRELNKNRKRAPITRPVYKITPMGFVDRDGKDIKYKSDDDDDLRIKGNVVDLRN